MVTTYDDPHKCWFLPKDEIVCYLDRLLFFFFFKSFLIYPEFMVPQSVLRQPRTKFWFVLSKVCLCETRSWGQVQAKHPQLLYYYLIFILYFQQSSVGRPMSPSVFCLISALYSHKQSSHLTLRNMALSLLAFNVRHSLISHLLYLGNVQ